MVYQFKGHDVTKVVDETKFPGRKTLSITNCPEVQLLKGGLESVQGLEEVNLADVRKTVLEDGAFSGKLLKRISGEVTVELLMARWLLITHVAIFCNSIKDHNCHWHEKGHIQQIGLGENAP